MGKSTLSENIWGAVMVANSTGPQGQGTPFKSILTGVVSALLRVASQHDDTGRWYA